MSMERGVRMNSLSFDRGERGVVAKADNNVVLSIYIDVYTYKIHLHIRLPPLINSNIDQLVRFYHITSPPPHPSFTSCPHVPTTSFSFL